MQQCCKQSVDNNALLLRYATETKAYRVRESANYYIVDRSKQTGSIT